MDLVNLCSLIYVKSNGPKRMRIGEALFNWVCFLDCAHENQNYCAREVSGFGIKFLEAGIWCIFVAKLLELLGKLSSQNQ